MRTNRFFNWVCLFAAAATGIVAAEMTTTGTVSAEIFRNVASSLSSTLATIAETEERKPRDLVANGQHIKFTPYQSRRSV